MRLSIALVAALLPLSSLHAQSAPALPAARHPGSGQVMYFVLTDRFANGDPANDQGGITGTREEHGFDPTGKGWYHGGDLKGLTSKLDYLAGLGVNALWITPPFVNRPVQRGSAGYHGYWILDFLRIDPHLGTEQEFRQLVSAAHARGLRVFVDIVINHTADVITYPDGNYHYLPRAKPAYRPLVPAGWQAAKNPAWLNNPAYYHNRGDSTFKGESSLFGDFVGLDDVNTEHPDVLAGMEALYAYWMREYGIDGYRIDTVRHVNKEFWQAFCPSLRATTRSLGRPDFFHFGEAMVADARFLGDFTVETGMDATLDFALWKVARQFFSRDESAERIDELWAEDDRLVRPLGDAHLQATFVGNHDDGRFLYFVKSDQPGAAESEVFARGRLALAFLLLSRGQPVLYYGDEQGLAGMGNDQMAREDMFPSRAVEYRDLSLVGSVRRGTDDKFDPEHPLYRLIGELARLRRAHPALSEGATRALPTGNARVAAFSRVHRNERVDHIVLFNRGREPQSVTLNLGLPGGTTLAPLAGDLSGAQTVDDEGRVVVTLPAFSYSLLRASSPRPAPAAAPSLAITPAKAGSLSFATTEYDGLVFPNRAEIAASVTGSDGLGEVTFTAERSSRPGEHQLLGVDDAPPYRVFWRPNPDWQKGETVRFTATYDDLRGHRLSATGAPQKIRGDRREWGPVGADAPRVAAFTLDGPASPRTLTVVARGTAPLFYTWYRDGERLAEQGPVLRLPPDQAQGDYTVVVHNQAGAVVAGPIVVKN